MICEVAQNKPLGRSIAKVTMGTVLQGLPWAQFAKLPWAQYCKSYHGHSIARVTMGTVLQGLPWARYCKGYHGHGIARVTMSTVLQMLPWDCMNDIDDKVETSPQAMEDV